MKKTVIIVASITLLSSCSVEKTYMPDGREGYTVDCSGRYFSWADCYRNAGNTCGSKGYDVISKNSDKGNEVNATMFNSSNAKFNTSDSNSYGNLHGGSVITRNLVIACKR